MTKQQLIELFQKSGSGGNVVPDNYGKLHPQVIEKYFELAYNTLIHQAYKESKGNIDQLDNYTKTFVVDVEYDSTREKYYSDLPASIVPIPDFSPIRTITAVKDESYVINIIPVDSIDTFSDLEVSKIDREASAMQEGNKVYYKWLSEDVDQVLMKLIIAFDSFEETDNINLPAGKETMLFDLVLNLMREQKVIPEDKANDENYKIR